MWAGSVKLFGSANLIGRRIKETILEELGLVASVGVARNKFLAKLASDLEKPDGFVTVPDDDIEGFLSPLPVGRLWGVGKMTNRKLQQLGIRTIGDLRRLGPSTAREMFGTHGDHLWELSHGRDSRTVVADRAAKSISHETTFAIDVSEREVLHAWLLELAEQVGRRLRRNGLAGRTVHLKVRFSDFRTITRATRLANSTDVTQEIYESARELFDARVPQDGRAVRLVGVGLSHLERERERQQSLFDEGAHRQHRRLDQATDDIRAKFGTAAVSRGERLRQRTEHRPPPRPD